MDVLSSHEILKRTLESCPLDEQTAFNFKWFIWNESPTQEIAWDLIHLPKKDKGLTQAKENSNINSLGFMAETSNNLILRF